MSLAGKASPNYGITPRLKGCSIIISAPKIKDKLYDGNTDAEFARKPYLTGIYEGDDVYLKGKPKFKHTGPGNNIEIDFSGLYIAGYSASNYNLTMPKNIYANIISNDIDDNLSYDSKDNIIAFINPPEPTKNNKFKTTDPKNNLQRDMNYDSDNLNDSTQPDSDKPTTDDDSDAIFEAEDSKTGIQVYAPKGVFPKWSRLIVREMYPNTDEYDNAYGNIDENIKRKIEHIKLYEVYVVNQDGEVIQPNISKGLITVRVPIPNDYDLADLQIYRIKQDADDNFETNIVNIKNRNYCEFQTNHFSPYTMIDEKTINDIILSILPYLILIFLILLIIILIKRKKDKEEEAKQQQQ